MRYFLALLVLLFGTNAYGAALPVNCANDGTHALTYSTSTNNYFCSTITGTGGGPVSLGTSTSAANPQISGDTTSGFYTPATNTVAVTAGGKEVMQWNTATSAVNYFTVTPSATGVAPNITNAGIDTAGAGLGITFTAKNASATGQGGGVNITAGNGFGTGATAIGGLVTLTGGSSNTNDNTSSPGVSILGGNATSGAGGRILIKAGSATSGLASGDVTIQGADGLGAAGGTVTIKSGGSNTTQSGVTTTISGGDGGTAGNQNGGQLMLMGGAANGSATGGTSTIQGGSGVTTGNGGTATVRGANGGSTSGDGGIANVISGNGIGTSHNGGALNVTSGNGGAVTSNGGALNVTTGNGGSTTGNSGTLTLNTGTTTSGTVGSIVEKVGGVTYETIQPPGTANSSVVFNGSDAVTVPIGTTGQRPSSGVNGMLRYNSTNTAIEAYQNNAWSSPAYSLTTTGTSGAATLTNGVLNVPQYTGGGGTAIFKDSGMTTAASGSTNATAWQAAINTQVAIGTAAANGYASVQAIGIPAGIYAVSSAITVPLQAVKNIAQAGPVEINMVGIGTSAVGITLTNDSGPAGEFAANANGANDGCALNGTNGNINFIGPLAANNSSTTSIGIRMGSTTAVGSDDKAMRQSCISHIQAQNFAYGIQISPNNIYMTGGDHIQLTYNNCGMATVSASSNVNSGENIQWRWGDISGNNVGFCDQTPNIDMVFDGFSFDNNTTAHSTESSNAGYSTQRYPNGHQEDFAIATKTVDATGICSSGIGADAGNTFYIYENEKFVWNFTAEVPFNHFVGCITVDLVNNTFAGYGTFGNSAALSAYYMMDANVIPRHVRGNSFYDNVTQKQLISRALNVVNDSTFSKGVNGGNILTSTTALPTWSIDATNACNQTTPTVDTTTTWTAGSGSASIKFVSSGASQTCTIDSGRIPVSAGERLLGDIIVLGGTSTGTGTIMGMYFNWIPCDPNISVSFSSEVGDDLNVIYGGGARTAAAKVQTLLDATVPAGICYAQMVLNPFFIPNGQTVWILDAEVNKI